MNDIQTAILIYGLILFLFGAFSTLLISLDDSAYDSEQVLFDKTNFFLCVFMYQSLVWQHCESLNVVGKVINEIIVTLIVFPLNIIVFLVLCILEFLFFIYACYMFIFGKEHKWYYLKAMKEEYEKEKEILRNIKDHLLK